MRLLNYCHLQQSARTKEQKEFCRQSMVKLVTCDTTCAAHYAASSGFWKEYFKSWQILWKVSDSSMIFANDEKTRN